MSCGTTTRLSTWLCSRLKIYGENADNEMMKDDDDSFWETNDENRGPTRRTMRDEPGHETEDNPEDDGVMAWETGSEGSDKE